MEQKHTPQILKLAEKRTISARTNFELVNLLLNKDLKGLQQSGYKVSSNILLWMIHIDGKTRNDWRNTWRDNDTILEEYVGNDNYKETVVKEPYRIVAEIKDGLFGRKYIIHGIFRCIEEKTENCIVKHLWIKDI